MSSRYIPNRQGTPPRLGVRARKKLFKLFTEARAEQLTEQRERQLALAAAKLEPENESK